MNTRAPAAIDDAICQVTAAVAALRAAVAHSSDGVSPETLTSALRAADALTATAVGVLTRPRHRIEARTGLPTEMLIRLEARQNRWDARTLMGGADALRGMPRTADALAAGIISWSQVRQILYNAKTLNADARAQLDEVVASRARALATAEPERLIYEADDCTADLDAARRARREQRAIETSFLTVQPRLEGGGSLYGEADAESFTTICHALDGMADRPVNADQDDPDEPTTRARQRMRALTSICEASLGGDAAGGSARAKPRFLVVMDATSPESLATGAQLLGATPGRPIRLTSLATERLLCEASITPIVFKDGQPIGIGDTRPGIQAKIRAALVARDGGCRFPGCDMPAAWADAHHVVHRGRGGDANVRSLALFCRRCHNRIHHKGWSVEVHNDGTIIATRGGRRYVSHPRARSPSRE